jgi:hypothetical protein
LPSRASSRARSIVSCSGMVNWFRRKKSDWLCAGSFS